MSFRIRILYLLLALCRSTAFTTRPGRPRITTALSSTTSSSSVVVYQKVVRANANVPEGAFLGGLVEFLQDCYELPPRLPMVYETKVIDDTSNDLVEWTSPLSPNKAATSLFAQVVAITTAGSTAMAMVVVKKESSTAWKDLPPMMQSLFKGSEQQILQALDRQLDDYVAGKITLKSNKSSNGSNNKYSRASYYDAANEMLQEVVNDTPQSRRGSDKSDKSATAFIEADFEKDTSMLKGSNKSGVSAQNSDTQKGSLDDTEKKVSNVSNNKTTANTDTVDYAVQAALKIATAKLQNKSKAANTKKDDAKKAVANDTDFAVNAARKAIANGVLTKKPATQSLPSRKDVLVNDKSSKNEFTMQTPIELVNIRPPSLHPDAAGTGSFMHTVSTPEQYKKRKAERTSSRKKDIAVAPSFGSHVTNEQELLNSTVKSTTKKQRNINVNIVNATKPDDMLPQVGVTKLDIQDEETKFALDESQKALDEMVKDGEELSPEDLLRKVMKFDESQAHENQDGYGFVDGAYREAKELLQKDNKSKDVSNNKDLKYKEKPNKYEEEVRKMFEAGVQIADGQLAAALRKNGASNVALDRLDKSSEAIVDALVDAETTVSSYARSLDKELTQLEVRLNRSPGEENDGPAKGQFIDPMSGPEVYNPNVDPETAVNWPGAKSRQDVASLSPQLQEAVRQASFAAEVLVKLSESGDGKVGDRKFSSAECAQLQSVVREAVHIGLIDNPITLVVERGRLQMLIDELERQPEERMREIASNYKDLLLSDNFTQLVRERLSAMIEHDAKVDGDNGGKVHDETAVKERKILGQLVTYAQLLLKEAQALGAELEAQQIEVVRSICNVAMDPTYRSEEETAAALADTVRDMRPLFDDAFIAYLKFAIAEESGRLARAGVLDDPDHNRWLFVLKIVQQGVYQELSRGLSRYVDHIGYVLRMETPVERRRLLEELIDVMPTLDVRPFVKVVDNIVSSLGDSVEGSFDYGYELGEMTNKLLQLRRDVSELLPPERIALMSKDADDWAARQRQKLREQREAVEQRLQAARDTEDYEDEVKTLGMRSEMERIE